MIIPNYTEIEAVGFSVRTDGTVCSVNEPVIAWRVDDAGEKDPEPVCLTDRVLRADVLMYRRPNGRLMEAKWGSIYPDMDSAIASLSED
jgi:hypothetical protein